MSKSFYSVVYLRYDWISEDVAYLSKREYAEKFISIEYLDWKKYDEDKAYNERIFIREIELEDDSITS